MCQLQNDPEKIRTKSYRSNMPPDSAFTYGLINTSSSSLSSGTKPLPPHIGHCRSSSVPFSMTPSPLQSGQVFTCASLWTPPQTSMSPERERIQSERGRDNQSRWTAPRLPVGRLWSSAIELAFPPFAINEVGVSLLALCDERRTANRTLECQGSRVVCHHIRQVLRPNAIKGIRDR